MPIYKPTTKDNDERYTPVDLMHKVSSANQQNKFTIDLATCDEAFRYQRSCFVPDPKLHSSNDPFDQLPEEYFFWCNPPYSQNPSFASRLSCQLKRTHSSSRAGAVLVNSNTETEWFREYAKKATAILFLKKRVQFLLPGLIRPMDSNGKVLGNQKPQTLFIYGTDWILEKLPEGLLTRNLSRSAD